MKRIIKFTFYLGLLISICFSSLSFVFSNEKSLKWLISNLSQNLGFEIETTVENIDWKIYESQISFEKISVSSLKTDKVQSFTAAGIDFNINFLDKFDPNSTVIFQSDHNWEMSHNQQEKKMIFNLIKVNSNCKIEKNINLHNVNVLRLVMSCMTGNKPKYTNN